jgi:membrane protein required for colicin V production
MAAPELGWVDWTMLGLLALSVLVGLWRGLVFELMAVVGWVVAYVVAQLFSSDVAAHVPVGTRGEALNLGVAFASGPCSPACCAC